MATLQLKLREQKGITGQVDRREIMMILASGSNNDTKADMLTVLLERTPIRQIHDSRWLREIINWVPVDSSGRVIGISLVEQSRWIRLAIRLDTVDDSENTVIEISEKEKKSIWDRIRKTDYRVLGLPVTFAMFIVDFCEACGYNVDKIADELEDD